MAEHVLLADWAERVAQAKADGFDHLWNLVAVDDVGRSNHIRVLLWLRNRDGETLTLATMCDRDAPHVPDISELFAGAAWLQRQAHDFFGVVFDGADNSPLLNHAGGAPLRKDVLLPPRLETRWPGALEPGESSVSPGRRRLKPPGVPDPKLLDDPAATAADIATSAAGMRVRRGR